ncbi:MAG TPA: metal ABC transporter permease [Solirubrobacteraceae bacterium]|nr:metal ABC transporter permease [Solirubrobacteraceae bacterium]
MFAHEFVRNALLAGSAVSIAAGLVGWFVVLRGQVFAADALSHVAFVGAIAAAVIAIDERIGLFALTLALAAVMAGLGRRAQADDVTIGVVFSWVLGVGALLISLLSSSSSGGGGLIVANSLFGSVFALTSAQTLAAVALGAVVSLAAVALARPLLLASLDAELAALQGAPARVLAVLLLLLLGAVTAEGTQVVGALLVLGLIAAPAGAAQRLTARPYRGMVLSAAIALASVWGGVALAYAIPSLPAGSAIAGLAVGAFAAASLTAPAGRWLAARSRRRQLLKTASTIGS